jgi:hypothetical protein
MSDTEALVYVDLARAPALVGRLWSRGRKGRESATFEYDKTWLEHPERFALGPALTLGPGPQHTETEYSFQGVTPSPKGKSVTHVSGRSSCYGPKGRSERTDKIHVDSAAVTHQPSLDLCSNMACCPAFAKSS